MLHITSAGASGGWRVLPAVLSIVGLLSCSDSTSPNTVFGTYRLTGYTVGGSEMPLPYMEASATPGDTDAWYGGSLTLRSDSTWTNVWQHVHCQPGGCGELHEDTLRGTFTLLPVNDTAGTTLVMRNEIDVESPGPALVRGRRLELYGFWLYER